MLHWDHYGTAKRILDGLRTNQDVFGTFWVSLDIMPFERMIFNLRKPSDSFQFYLAIWIHCVFEIYIQKK